MICNCLALNFLQCQRISNVKNLRNHRDCLSAVPEWSDFVLHLQGICLFLWLWLTVLLGLWDPLYCWGGAAAHHSGQGGDARSQPLRGTPAGIDRRTMGGMGEKNHLLEWINNNMGPLKKS